MRLLVDTHTLIWYGTGNTRLSVLARDLLFDDAIDAFISAVTVWEMGIKVASGRLPPGDDVSANLEGFLATGSFQPLSITIEHARRAAALPLLHADPFDRMLIAQAQLEGLAILTADKAIERYDVETLW